MIHIENPDLNRIYKRISEIKDEIQAVNPHLEQLKERRQMRLHDFLVYELNKRKATLSALSELHDFEMKIIEPGKPANAIVNMRYDFFSDKIIRNNN